MVIMELVLKGILDLFCKEIGFDKVYGRLYETDENLRFTGKIVDEEIISKKSIKILGQAQRSGFTSPIIPRSRLTGHLLSTCS